MKVHPVHRRVRPSRAPASQNPVHRRGGYPWRDGPVESNQGRKPAKPEQLSRIPAMTRPSGRMQKIAHPRAFSRFGGAAAPQQATKKKISVAGTATYASCYSRRAEPHHLLGKCIARKENIKYEKECSASTTSVTCYTDRVMTCFLQAKNAKPKPVKGAPGESRALARLLGPGSELQSAG